MELTLDCRRWSEWVLGRSRRQESEPLSEETIEVVSLGVEGVTGEREDGVREESMGENGTGVVGVTGESEGVLDDRAE